VCIRRRSTDNLLLGCAQLNQWPTFAAETGRCQATLRRAGRVAIADYVDNFYNVERRHTYLDNIGPSEFEWLWASTYSIPQLA
jgi:hypothetical protein